MHRNRTWLLDPIELRTQRNRILPIEGGDGSTLSLDFTTGVLDPRLTFTRTSDATFINSSGQVQYADANWVRNSTMLVSTGWTATTVSGGTATINGDGSVTFASTAGRITWLQTLGLASGLQITFSIEVTALTAGDIRVSDLFAAGFGFGSQIYHHTSPSGVTQNNISSSAGLGTFGVGLYTVTATTTGTTNNIVFGTDCNGVNRTGSVTIRNPQLQYGTVVPRRVYVPNSSTSSTKWDSARFDYDPTTLAPRGLLIEGSANNTISNSNTIYTGAWGGSLGITGTQDTTIPDPSGGTTTCKIVKSAGIQYVVRNQPIPTLTVPANSTVSLTASVWLRMDGANQVAASLGIYDGATASFGTRSGASVSNSAVTISSGSSADAEFTFGTVTGWVRCSISRSFTNSTGSSITFPSLQFYIYPNRVNTNAATIYAWGAQVESGVGASSLIPTGASTGNRQVDSLVIQDGAWRNTANIDSTWYVDGVLNKMNTAFNPIFLFVGNAGYTEQNRVFISATGSQVRFWHYARSASVNPDFEYAINQASPNGYVYGSRFKVAATFDNTAGENRSSWNGATSNGSTAAACTTTPTYFTITVGNGNDWHFRSIKYWPLSLPQTTLNGITTL